MTIKYSRGKLLEKKCPTTRGIGLCLLIRLVRTRVFHVKQTCKSLCLSRCADRMHVCRHILELKAAIQQRDSLLRIVNGDDDERESTVSDNPQAPLPTRLRNLQVCVCKLVRICVRVLVMNLLNPAPFFANLRNN